MNIFEIIQWFESFTASKGNDSVCAEPSTIRSDIRRILCQKLVFIIVGDRLKLDSYIRVSRFKFLNLPIEEFEIFTSRSCREPNGHRTRGAYSGED